MSDSLTSRETFRQMHPRPHHSPDFVLSTAGLAEVGDGAELGVDGPAAKPAVLQVLHGLLGVLLPPELDVHVADQVVPQVVTHVHLLDLTVLGGRERMVREKL